jgi:hypothetical protein
MTWLYRETDVTDSVTTEPPAQPHRPATFAGAGAGRAWHAQWPAPLLDAPLLDATGTEEGVEMTRTGAGSGFGTAADVPGFPP